MVEPVAIGRRATSTPGRADEVRANLPVWELLNFQFYCGVFALSDKMAMRTAHVPELDFAWGYTSILSHACGKTNYGKYGVVMNLVLHSSHQWVRDILDHVRTYRLTDRPCTGMGLDCAVEHGVRTSKAGVHRVTNERLDAVSVARTACRESKARYEEYVGASRVHTERRLVNVAEDVQLLVDQFNLSFGTTWDELAAPKTWSKFANRGIHKPDCGGTLIGTVWAGIPDWVEKMTVTTDEQPIPALFEPPDVDDQEFYEVEDSMSGGDDDDDDAAGTDDADPGAAAGSWAKRAAAQWMRTHDKRDGGDERQQQLETIFARSQRREKLHEKACAAAAAEEAAAAEAEAAAATRAYTRAQGSEPFRFFDFCS
jgi:hypothetical protein